MTFLHNLVGAIRRGVIRRYDVAEGAVVEAIYPRNDLADFALVLLRLDDNPRAHDNRRADDVAPALLEAGHVIPDHPPQPEDMANVVSDGQHMPALMLMFDMSSCRF
jgi:hypothetical protein